MIRHNQQCYHHTSRETHRTLFGTEILSGVDSASAHFLRRIDCNRLINHGQQCGDNGKCHLDFQKTLLIFVGISVPLSTENTVEVH